MPMFTMKGRLIRSDGRFKVIEAFSCSDGKPVPRYLKTLFLTSLECPASIQIGDDVLLDYRTSRNYGLWFAHKDMTA